MLAVLPHNQPHADRAGLCQLKKSRPEAWCVVVGRADVFPDDPIAGLVFSARSFLFEVAGPYADLLSYGSVDTTPFARRGGPASLAETDLKIRHMIHELVPVGEAI